MLSTLQLFTTKIRDVGETLFFDGAVMLTKVVPGGTAYFTAEIEDGHRYTARVERTSA